MTYENYMTFEFQMFSWNIATFIRLHTIYGCCVHMIMRVGWFIIYTYKTIASPGRVKGLFSICS